MPEVLLVDDDPRLREMARFILARAGYTVREATNGVEALEACARSLPDLVVLDVLMPELDGHSVCRALRAQSESGRVPILFLSTRGEAFDRVVGLDLGADDYLPKPFLPSELVSRAKAILRRSAPDERSATLAHGPVKLDPAAFRVTVHANPVDLTVTEFRILQALLRQPGQLVTRESMVKQAYGGAHHISPRTLDSHIRGVRQKLRDAGLDAGGAGGANADPSLGAGAEAGIETLVGLGWRWA